MNGPFVHTKYLHTSPPLTQRIQDQLLLPSCLSGSAGFERKDDFVIPWWSHLQSSSTTNRKDLAIHPPCILTAQERHYAGDILRVAGAVQRGPAGGYLFM